MCFPGTFALVKPEGAEPQPPLPRHLGDPLDPF